MIKISRKKEDIEDFPRIYVLLPINLEDVQEKIKRLVQARKSILLQKNNVGILIQVIQKKNFNLPILVMLDFLKKPIIVHTLKL